METNKPEDIEQVQKQNLQMEDSAKKKKKMKVLFCSIIILVIILIALKLIRGCIFHNWQEVTCTTPKTCEDCGKTVGEPLGHDYKEATCTTPKTCNICGDKQGTALGHTWQEATCIEPKTCSVCGKTEGKALGHTYTDYTVITPATCTSTGEETATCTVCGYEGTQTIPLLAHTYAEYTVVTPATCTATGKESSSCTVCGHEETKTIPALGHQPGDWQITTAATLNASGTKQKLCSVCGEVIETQYYDLTSSEKIAAYKAQCQSFGYEEIARNPDTYKDKYAVFTGEVIQVLEDGNNYNLRVNVTKTRYGYTDTILVLYTKNDSNESRILEDDIVTLYGTLNGTTTYTSVLGQSITIPSMTAKYVVIN